MATLRSNYTQEAANGAYSTSTTTAFTIPVLGGSDTQEFNDISWVSMGQPVYFADGAGTTWGFFKVVAVDVDNKKLALQNEWNEVGGGATIPVGSKLSPGASPLKKNELGEIIDFETTTQLDARDILNRERVNHTGTQTASTISDFDTEVSNNSDVAANTSARHDAVTVVDSSEIGFTLTGQQITASIVAGSIDESKLDASVNASLDLADTALQSQTFNESIVIYLSPLDVDIAATTKAAIIPYLPYNLEVSELVLECDVAPTGSDIQVDINVDGTSFLTTIISIDATETSSTTAATAYAIDTTTFPNSRIPKGSTVTVDIDQPGTTVAGQNLVLVINGVRY